MSEPLIYAIDFGTSNSLLAAATPTRVLGTIPLDPGAADTSVLKSVFYTSEPGAWHFGEDAIGLYTQEGGQGRLFRSIKKYLPEPGFTGTQVHGRNESLTDLVAVFLRHLKGRADAHFGREATAVVLGRPARYAMDEARDKLAEDRMAAAARLAGFRDVAFCPEPVAAAHDFRARLDAPRTVLIADFGGGTSDFTVVRLGPGPFTAQDVLGLGGVALAGDHFDGAIMRHAIAPHFGSQVTYRVPMGSNDMSLPKSLIGKICHPADAVFLGQKHVWQYLQDVERYARSDEDKRRMRQLFTLVEEHLGYRLFSAIEAGKKALSESDSAPFRFAASDIAISETLDRASFEAHSADVTAKILGSLDATLAQAGLGPDGIDIVCCTGGTAKIPAILAGLVSRFGTAKLTAHNHFHSVILGLGQKASAVLRGEAAA